MMYFFKPTDQIVLDHVRLINLGKPFGITFDEVPDIFNLREAVAEALGAHKVED